MSRRVSLEPGGAVSSIAKYGLSIGEREDSLKGNWDAVIQKTGEDIRGRQKQQMSRSRPGGSALKFTPSTSQSPEVLRFGSIREGVNGIWGPLPQTCVKQQPIIKRKLNLTYHFKKHMSPKSW